MKDKSLQITENELLGQALDGIDNKQIHLLVVLNMVLDPLFEERYIVSLQAIGLFDDKKEIYETV